MGRSSCDGIEYGVYPFQSLFLFYSLDSSLYWILDRMTHDTFFYFLLLLAHYFSFLSLSSMFIFGLKE